MSEVALSLEVMQDKCAEAAEFMRLFSTPSRLMLLCHIAQRERSVGEIQEDLDFKQPALSQQLAELRQAGVVQTRRASRQIYYSIADDRVAVVMNMLMQMFCGPAYVNRPIDDPVKPAVTKTLQVVRSTFPGEMARWARLEAAE
ncbi:ArsR/SmtB family transcription factor [Agrobacterium sp. ICMP 6402]|uniref:ArsR/SmtB family transcription factor n=1 Tax=Rhizobium/Agrobacterium group TaxID=227290 RepID=UPI0012967DF4|nr:metalloregulator ArsR/SmtB family transcription factor [Agrobacterium sp. ICMP 6402]MQB13155.1 ArsR family transcriptional regulator [Agrobacterium sp. ICMP 6402]